MTSTPVTFIPIDLNNPMEMEAFSNKLLIEYEDGGSSLKPEHSRELAQLIQNKWIGLQGYAHAYARDWVNNEEMVKQIGEDLEKAESHEEATEAVLIQLRRWGRQAAGDFIGAFCFLEAKAGSEGGDDAIIAEIRRTERAYAGYLAAHEQELIVDEPASGLKPGDSLYIAQPLFQHAPGFMDWLFGAVDISLLNRRPLIKEALIADSFEQLLLKALLASGGVVEEVSLFGAYCAYLLDLPRFYRLGEEAA